MSLRPTHHIILADGTAEADIRIADSLLDKLNSRHPQTRWKAQDSVCIAFRETCIPRLGARWAQHHQFIDWNDLTITEIGHLTEEQWNGEACDECVNCNAQEHGMCLRSAGCPLATLR